MPRSRKIALVSLATVVALGLGWGIYLLALAGQLTSLEFHSDAACERIEGVVGAEDLAFTAASGTPEGGVFVSSDDRRATAAGNPVRGAIYYYSLAADPPAVYAASGDAPEVFHPHGIGSTPESAATERLFVVNHPGRTLFGPNEGAEGPAHTIEVFDVVNEDGRVRLALQRTITDPLLVSPNDIAPVDEERFYVTNDHLATSALGHKLEDYGRLARGHVLYWDGAAFSVVAKGILYANGVNVSRDGKTVYVAAVTGGRVHVFDRDQSSGALTPREEVPVHGPDNITIAADDSLWIGAHPKLLSFSAYAKDATKRSPSQVVRLAQTESGAWETEDVWLSDGSEMSGSSVALGVGADRFLVGSVFDAWLLDCTRSP
ncbi:Serum paraoxonase/arylesterase 2 [Enhygromyxa salina]|uniref:Serum paraoxonase/arylesterase 2 n=1 Tax=Enhygromyxa salina TaxID=215803 RepID=A0A0C2CLQ9_9BACT|nr:SMP-30/gluconolactonase/LRE family protein [Enhygromyxa salina]KIG12171.1 Serum paraoxonase/arylesterase 2 [Enhygromyxa salina]